MEKKVSIAGLVLQAIAVAMLVVVLVRPAGLAGGFGAQTAGWVTNFSALQLDIPTIQPTDIPGLNIEHKGIGQALEIRNASSTPVFSVSGAGAVSYVSSSLCNTCIKYTGATAATTATPVFRIDNAADANNLVSIEKDATPVVVVGNAGAMTLANGLTISSGGMSITAGGAVVGGKLVHTCVYYETAGNANLTVAASCYVVNQANAVDLALQTTNAVTGTVLYITSIGAGTTVITDTNLLSHDGNALSLGAGDAAIFVFNGTKWAAIVEAALE